MNIVSICRGSGRARPLFLCHTLSLSLSFSLPHGILQLSAAGIEIQREDDAAATSSGQGREKS